MTLTNLVDTAGNPIPDGTVIRVDLFKSDLAANPPRRYYLGTFVSDPNPNSPDSVKNGRLNVSLTIDPNLVTTKETAIATVTLASTSPFSNTSTTVAPNIVTSTANDGVGSLRLAIVAFDKSTLFTSIDFAFSQGVAPFTITVNDTALPTITRPVTIDGRNVKGVPNPGGNSLVQITAGAGIPGDGLVLDIGADNSTIRGLAIYGFQNGAGLHVNSSGNTIVGSFFGTDVNTQLGTQGNSEGILIEGGSNTIGGTNAADRVVVAGNITNGIEIRNSSGALIRDAVIGTTTVQTVDQGQNTNNGNRGDGVLISGSSSNTLTGTIGGQAPLVISGNIGAGIHLTNNNTTGSVSIKNLVMGALIGTDQTGAASSRNFANGDGVKIDGGSSANTIGGTFGGTVTANTSPTRNVISGNAGAGILITGADRQLCRGRPHRGEPGRFQARGERHWR